MSFDRWPTVTLGEVTQNFDAIRRPVRGADRKPGMFPYYGASGIVDYVDDFLFEGEHLLVAEDGENLRTRKLPIAFLADGKFWVNNHAHIVRGNERADTKFLCYQLSQTDISGYLSGSTMPKLTQGSLNRILLKLPPLAEQRAIARVLGSLDDKIELNRRMNGTLEAMARALFKSWFVDFDPVHANAAGNPTLPPDLAALFPSEFVTSELGNVPKGWEIRSLDEIASYLNSLALQKYPPKEGESTLPVLKIAQLRKGDTHAADRCNATLPDKYVVHDGDIIFSWSGSLMVRLWTGGDAALNQHLFKVASEEFPRWFYYLWTLHHLESFQQTAASKATTMGHIKRHHLSDAKALVPRAKLRNAMTAMVGPILEEIVVNDLQSRTLAALRDALLPKLLSGELSVADAEEAVA